MEVIRNSFYTLSRHISLLPVA